ncbi:MAG: hypothetical protein K0U36_00175 [Alphaproteobacteria bacterium]|nr:hypothetical protein [Alphaproteobacteria bacterium]
MFFFKRTPRGPGQGNGHFGKYGLDASNVAAGTPYGNAGSSLLRKAKADCAIVSSALGGFTIIRPGTIISRALGKSTETVRIKRVSADDFGIQHVHFSVRLSAASTSYSNVDNERVLSVARFTELYHP